jgi:uncharacterized protein (TIGR04562 family)
MSQSIHDRLDEFRLPWESLDVVLSGKSPMDVPRWLKINDYEDAENFLQSYGFDFQNPIEQAEIYGHYQETLNFVRKYFLYPENPEGIKDEIPQQLLNLSDFRQLFVMATEPNQKNADLWRKWVDDPFGDKAKILHRWSQALLKILHTIAHLDKDLKSYYFNEVQKQILDRFYKYISRDSDEKLFLRSGEETINLAGFEIKPKKTRESVILKLLYKPKNVAEDIFDYIGVRLITEDRLDILKSVKFLLDNNIIMPANISPHRSKNNLIDLRGCRKSFKELTMQIKDGKKRPRDFHKAFNDVMGNPPNVEHPNVHSHAEFRTIQFTARQLINYRNPIFRSLLELKEVVRGTDTENIQDEKAKKALELVQNLDSGDMRREIRFFYPFEIQLVDKETHEVNKRGEASHQDYKQNQINHAIKRVMGPFLYSQRNK